MQYPQQIRVNSTTSHHHQNLPFSITLHKNNLNAVKL